MSFQVQTYKSFLLFSNDFEERNSMNTSPDKFEMYIVSLTNYKVCKYVIAVYSDNKL